MSEFSKRELDLILNYMFGGSYQTNMDEMATLKEKVTHMISKASDFPHKHQWIARSPTIQIETVFGQKAELCPLIIRCKTCGESYFA